MLPEVNTWCSIIWCVNIIRWLIPKRIQISIYRLSIIYFKQSQWRRRLICNDLKIYISSWWSRISIPLQWHKFGTKIKEWLEDEIQSSREVIAEYTDNHRPKCDDGSDDFIEGNYNTAQRLLLQIKEWEN